jgi:hypothetical protein
MHHVSNLEATGHLRAEPGMTDRSSARRLGPLATWEVIDTVLPLLVHATTLTTQNTLTDETGKLR